MDIQKQIAFEKSQAKDVNCDYEELKQRLDRCEKLSGHRYLPTSPRHEAWLVWDAAWQAAQAVPEGFVLAPVEEVKTWYLDDDESIYREDPDWLCNTPVGEVVEVERRISYELDQAPVFAAITWDEDNQDVGYYETFATKDEAQKAATHCKAMKEAQEQKG